MSAHINAKIDEVSKTLEKKPTQPLQRQYQLALGHVAACKKAVENVQAQVDELQSKLDSMKA
eukprot:4793775-Alexandrium_andersonii.AAC.1